MPPVNSTTALLMRPMPVASSSIFAALRFTARPKNAKNAGNGSNAMSAMRQSMASR